MRCFNRIVRHTYNAYTACTRKFTYFMLDWLRMTSFYILYTSEYALTVSLVVSSMPKLRTRELYTMPNFVNFNLDYTLVYYSFLAVSLPNFVSTWIYLHQKRRQQLYYVAGQMN